MARSQGKLVAFGAWCCVLLSACAGPKPQPTARGPIETPRDPLALASQAPAVVSPETPYIWGEALKASANQRIDVVEGWWKDPSPQQLGVLPFVIIDQTGRVFSPSASEADRRMAGTFGGGIAEFELGNRVVQIQFPAPPPATLTVEGKTLPVIKSPTDPWTGQPQSTFVLLGIMTAFALVPDDVAVVPHVLRDRLQLSVPPETIGAIEDELGPLQIRRSAQGQMAILFERGGRTMALVSERLKTAAGIVRGTRLEVVSNSRATRSAEPTPTASRCDTWPTFVSSLADL